MGFEGIAPKPETSKPLPEHEIYPYLLRNVKIVRPNQVWSTDITYCRLSSGFMYLVAVIDWVQPLHHLPGALQHPGCELLRRCPEQSSRMRKSGDLRAPTKDASSPARPSLPR